MRVESSGSVRERWNCDQFHFCILEYSPPCRDPRIVSLVRIGKMAIFFIESAALQQDPSNRVGCLT
jgi:hypothetical protein